MCVAGATLHSEDQELNYILKIKNCAYSVWDLHSLGVVTVRVEGGDGDGGGRGLSLGGFW